MAVRRIMPYYESADLEATRVFYTRVLGLAEGTFGGGYIGFGSGQAQVVFAPSGVERVLPDMGVDVDSREAVDAAHAEAVRAGHEVIYGPVDEPWGVRRFFVRDPQGAAASSVFDHPSPYRTRTAPPSTSAGVPAVASRAKR